MHITTGNILISGPFIEDPTFSRSVILIAEHNEHGSIGYVLNQKTDYALNMLTEGIDIANQNAYQGGLVELNSLHFIHTYDHLTGATQVMPNVHWGEDFDEVCSGIQNKVLKLQEFKFFVGYSGWAPGQLAHELKYHSWITGSLDADLIFNLNIDDEHLWKIALRTKGGSEALLANAPSDLLLN